MKDKDIKKEINNYDNKISQSKAIIKEYNKLEESFLSIDKNFGKYLSLLNSSIKGRKTNAILNQSYEVKNKCINDSLNSLSKNKKTVENQINDYVRNKEKLEKEYKENNKE